MVIAIILILLGFVFLGVNYNLITPGVWSRLIKLWPVVLIIIGLGIILKRAVPKWLYVVIVSLAILGFIGGAIYLSSTNSSVIDNDVTSIDEPLSSDVSLLKLDINLGAQDISIGNTSSGLMAGSFSYSGAQTKYIATSSSGTAYVKIYQNWKHSILFWQKPNSNGSSKLYLTDQIPIDITMNLGATNIDADFTHLMMRSVNLNTGALNGSFKFGSLAQRLDVGVKTGATSLKYYIPKTCGLKVDNDSGLVGISFSNLDMTSDSSQRKSLNYDATSCVINFAIASGVSNFEFIGY